ncbi:10304_t:CDS:2, partial [Gigaspora margarita]
IVKNKEGIFVEKEETIIEKNKENEKAIFEDIFEENREEVTLKFYTSQSLTPNERYALLFNVENEVLKHSNAVRKLVEEEAVKNYPPPTIVSTIKDYATRKLDLGVSIKRLKRKEVSNIKQKVNEVQKNDSFRSNTNIDSDIAKCIHFLKNE